MLKLKIAATLLILLVIAGCSGNQNKVSDPISPSDLKHDLDISTQHRYLWGLWDLEFDLENKTVEAIPIRGTQFTCNVTQFLSPPSASENLIKFGWLDHEFDNTDLYVDMNVIITHPFENRPALTGFDVRGILITDGPVIDTRDKSIKYQWQTDQAASIENPDGFTRWWNHPEFSGTGSPLFTYNPAPGCVLNEPTATINPYKYFMEGLEPDKELRLHFGQDFDCENLNRGCFLSGSTLTRLYELKFPFGGGIYLTNIQYAIDACWMPGDPALSGDPDEWDIPGDFPPSVNGIEPMSMNVHGWDHSINMPSKVYLSMTFYDWIESPNQPITVERLHISTPVGQPPGPFSTTIEKDELERMRENWDWSPCVTSSYEVDFSGFWPSEAGEYTFLFAAQMDQSVTYDQGYSTPAPDIPITAYAIGTVDFINGSPISCPPPDLTAAYGYPLDTYPDETVTVDATWSYSYYEYYYHYDWENDGEWDLITMDDIVTHQYSEPGTYEIMVMLDGECYPYEDWLDEPIVINISNDCVPPTADMEIGGPFLDYWTGVPICFTTWYSGGTGPLTFSFDWDDGEGYSYITEEFKSYHTYDEPGVYQVMCKATNACGEDEIDIPIEITVLQY